MMTPKLGSKIQSVILIGSLLIVSACASTTRKPIASNTDETARTTIEKGKFETPPPLSQPAAPQPVIEPVKTVSQAEKDAVQTAKTTRINPKEPFVNVRTSSSIKSRLAAVLKGGQPIEVLNARSGWVKIKWQNGGVAKHGWVNKRFVEGYEP